MLLGRSSAPVGPVAAHGLHGLFPQAVVDHGRNVLPPVLHHSTIGPAFEVEGEAAFSPDVRNLGDGQLRA